MINYKLKFGSHLSLDFRKTACFAFMRNFKENLKYQYNIDYDHDDTIRISDFEYYDIPIKKNNDSHTHLVTYLCNKYEKYLVVSSVDKIIKSGAVRIRGTTPSREAHLIVSWFRFFDEYQYVVSNFHELEGSKYPDLAFIYSMLKTMGSNHSPLRNMTWWAIQRFMDGTVPKGEESLEEDPTYSRVDNYFSVGKGHGGKPRVLHDITSYEQLEKAYEKHCGAVAKKLRKAVSKGGIQRPNGLPSGRPYQWESVIFAAA